MNKQASGIGRWARLAVVLSVMSATGVIGACASITTTDGTWLRRGLPERKLTDKIGQPDVIGQTLGERTRYYFPGETPEEAWKDKGLVTNYYYLDRGYKITVTQERVRETDSITREELDAVLPMVRARRAE